MSERYSRSEELLARAERVIPLGTQTFSKSKTQLPHGVSPFYAARGKGARLWDVDGNEYLDFVNGLLSVSLGYDDPDVTAAVTAQLADGVTFSLPHTVEIEVAELICQLVPSAEMVRFGKNGSDATAGAARIARAFTGRERIAVCGYHGWQDWYIGTTARHRGVPEAVRGLTHVFAYNDLDSLQAVLNQHPGEFAAVVLEPMNTTWPAPGFLEGVAELTRKHGAVLVFDEMITGFRYANGGAQELFGVTPDLTTLGKGLANGYPLAAIVGRAEVMRVMEDIFFSFTMGSEALSLAAAKAVLNKLTREPVVQSLSDVGTLVLQGTAERIERHGLGAFAEAAGHPAWSFLLLKDAPKATAWELKTLFLQECFARGVLTLTSHNMSYAHGPEDAATLLGVYDQVFPMLAEAAENGVADLLRCKTLEPLFKVR